MPITFDPLKHPRDKHGRFTKSRTVIASAKDKRAVKDIMSGFKPAQADAKTLGDPEQQKAASGFAADAKAINEDLRAGHPDAHGVKPMDDAMRPTTVDLVLYRVVPAEGFGDVDPTSLQGMKVRDAGFAPTQLTAPQAGEGDVHLIIAAPKGSRAVVNAETGEVYLDRDSEMVVSRVEPNKSGGHDMYLTLLPKTGGKNEGTTAKPEPDKTDSTSSAKKAESKAPAAPKADAAPEKPAKTDIAKPAAAERTPAEPEAEKPQGEDEFRAQLMKQRVPELQAQMRERGLKPGRKRKSELVDALVADEMGHDDKAAPVKTETPSKPAVDAKTTTALETKAEPAKPAASIEDRIKQALVAEVTDRGDNPDERNYVMVSDLRKRLPDVSRAEFDAAINRIASDPHFSLSPESNQRVLTDEQRAGAVMRGNQIKHLLGRESAVNRGEKPKKVADAGTTKPQFRSVQLDDGSAPEEPPAEKAKTDGRPAGTGKVDGHKSTAPVARNTWGENSREPGEVHYHADGEIGTAIKSMGNDRLMDVDGQPLENVLGRIATDTVTGRTTAQQQLDELKTLRNRLPDGSAAQQQVDIAIRNLDAPNTRLPQIPAGTPKPLADLVSALHAVPLVRKDPAVELEPLLRLLDEFRAGKIGGSRLLTAVEKISNRRHESFEGKLEIDSAVEAAVAQLRLLAKSAGKGALYSEVKASAAPPDPHAALLQQQWEQSRTDLLKGWPKTAQPLVDELAGQAEAAANAGDLSKLGGLEASAGVIAALAAPLSVSGSKLAQLAAAGVVAEAADAKVPIEAPVDAGAQRVQQTAQAVAQIIARGYASGAARASLQLAGADPAEVKAAVAEQLGELGTAQNGLVSDNIGALLSAAQHAGRLAVLEQHPAKSYVAVEINDKSECPACAEESGKTFATLKAALKDYPSIGFVRCAGGSRCRGFVRPQW